MVETIYCWMLHFVLGPDLQAWKVRVFANHPPKGSDKHFKSALYMKAGNMPLTVLWLKLFIVFQVGYYTSY